MTNDEFQMTKEIGSTTDEKVRRRVAIGIRLSGRRFRHLDFVIPLAALSRRRSGSDFAIRHS